MTNSRSELRTRRHAERDSQDKGHGPPTAEAVRLRNAPNVHLGDPILAGSRSGFRPKADPELGIRTPRAPRTPYNVRQLEPSLGMGMGTREMYYIYFNHKRGDRAQLRNPNKRMHAIPDLCVLFAHVLKFSRSQVRDQTDRHARSCGSDKSDLGMPQKSCPAPL